VAVLRHRRASGIYAHTSFLARLNVAITFGNKPLRCFLCQIVATFRCANLRFHSALNATLRGKEISPRQKTWFSSPVPLYGSLELDFGGNRLAPPFGLVRVQNTSSSSVSLKRPQSELQMKSF
jgi:hypothetical protein